MCEPQRIEQALKDYQSGKDSEDSFALIDRYYRPRLIGFFAKRDFPQDTPKDLTQEVFFRVSRNMENFRGGVSIAAFSAWLFQIAENVGRDQWRSQIRQKHAGQTVSLDSGGDEGGAQSQPMDLPGPSQQPLEALLDLERRRLLKEAVDRLPKQMRNCLKLRLYQERSNQEIAILMNISIDTVKTHLRLGAAKLKAQGVFD